MRIPGSRYEGLKDYVDPDPDLLATLTALPPHPPPRTTAAPPGRPQSYERILGQILKGVPPEASENADVHGKVSD
jgi:hypothetical protein